MTLRSNPELRERNIAFVHATVGHFPALQPLLNEHLEDQGGELLPHIFFGDLTRYLLQLLDKSKGNRNANAARELHEILDFLDQTYANDAVLQELISVSFLENLQGENLQMRRLLGPHLKKQMKVICP